jgi:RNAse (barnase) inhibitor barstar
METPSIEHLSPNSIGSFRAACVCSGSVSSVQASLEKQGFRPYVFESSSVHDKNSLLSALVKCLSLTEYANNGLSSWDAASDVIWQVLTERPENRVALLWNHADVMVAEQLQLFLYALEMLYAVSDTLERQETIAGCHPVLLRIVLFGEGRSFPPWSPT